MIIKLLLFTILLYPTLSLPMDGEYVGSANKNPSSVKLKKQPASQKVASEEGFKFSKEITHKEKKLLA